MGKKKTHLCCKMIKKIEIDKNFKYNQRFRKIYAYIYNYDSSSAPDLPSLVLNQRIVFIGKPLASQVSELLIGELLWLNFIDQEKPIYMYINSKCSQNKMGKVTSFEGEVHSILDTLNYIKPSHRTLCVGQAFGNALVLLASGERGKREILPNACIMTYPPALRRSFGRSLDQMIMANQLTKTVEIYVKMLAKYTNKEIKYVRKITSRNKYWSPKNAKDFGLVDKIIGQ